MADAFKRCFRARIHSPNEYLFDLMIGILSHYAVDPDALLDNTLDACTVRLPFARLLASSCSDRLSPKESAHTCLEFTTSWLAAFDRWFLCFLYMDPETDCCCQLVEQMRRF
jgi:hypothetical protein